MAPRKKPHEHYTPKYDGVDGLSTLSDELSQTDAGALEDLGMSIHTYAHNGQTDVKSAEFDALAVAKTMHNVIATCLSEIAETFPTDIENGFGDDERRYLPWERCRMSLIKGFADTIHRQLCREFKDRDGKMRRAGLIAQRDAAHDRYVEFLGNPYRTEEGRRAREDYIRTLDEIITVMDGMARAATEAYNQHASQSPLAGDKFTPAVYVSPIERAYDAERNATAPITAAEYEALVRFGRQELADKMLAERNPGTTVIVDPETGAISFRRPAAGPAAQDVKAMAEQAKALGLDADTLKLARAMKAVMGGLV